MKMTMPLKMAQGLPGLPASMEPAVDFQQSVQAAFAQQRREQDKSMHNLVDAIARLCEQPGVTGMLIAESLRGLESARSTMGPQEMVPSGNVSDSETSGQEALPDARAFKKMNRSSTCASLDDTTSDDHIKQENHIKQLDFIGESGEIVDPPSSLERICGPSYSMLKQRLLSPYEACQPRTGRCAAAVDGFGFKVLTMTVIMLNFAFIIVQSDYRAQHLDQGDTPTMTALGYGFTAFYIFELCTLMFVHGKEFFVGPEMGYNLFDAAIVAVAIVDIMMRGLGVDGLNMSFLRVLRFFKISRVLRMFSALRTFKEIRIMIDALVGCLSIFVFCASLMAIFLSVFAIFFVQGATEILQNNVDLDAGLVLALRNDWSSVSGVMLQLFMVITGGSEWQNAYNVISQVGNMQAFLFVFFVAFYYLAFFNVVTSVFCEKAMSLATPTTSELISRRVQKEHHDALELKALLQHSLRDNTITTLNKQQMADFVHDPQVELYFDVRGLKSSSAHKLFRMLCEVHCTDVVPVGEFISALVKLDGTANSIDAHCLQVRQMHGLHQMKKIQEEQMDEITGLREVIEGMQQMAPVAYEGHCLFPPLPSHTPVLQGKDDPDEYYNQLLPALPMMNDTLKLLRNLVNDPSGVSAVGDGAYKVVNKLMPLCSSLPFMDREHSSSSSDTSAQTASTMSQMKNMQETLCDELSEMQQTIKEIQQTMPTPPQCQWSSETVFDDGMSQARPPLTNDSENPIAINKTAPARLSATL